MDCDGKDVVGRLKQAADDKRKSSELVVDLANNMVIEPDGRGCVDTIQHQLNHLPHTIGIMKWHGAATMAVTHLISWQGGVESEGIRPVILCYPALEHVVVFPIRVSNDTSLKKVELHLTRHCSSTSEDWPTSELQKKTVATLSWDVDGVIRI